MTQHTIRRLILENIKAAIEGIASIRKVALHEFDITKLETYPVPAAFVYPDTGDDFEAGNRFDTWTLPVVVEVWGRDIEVEDLIGEIHVEMMQDRKRGGYAEKTKRLGGTDVMFYTGRSASFVGLSVRFEVTYSHLPDDPFSQEED